MTASTASGRSIAIGFRTILAACPKCGNPVPINGLVSRPQCPECLGRIDVASKLWERALAMNGLEMVGSSPGKSTSTTISVAESPLEMRVARVHVSTAACPSCEADLPALPDTGEVPAPIRCEACGETATPQPLSLSNQPEGLTPRYVVAAEWDSDSRAAGAVAAAVAEQAAPVIMACPRCSGDLEVTAQSDRTVPCKYCDASAYLPDGLWRKLHPVKTAAMWTAVLSFVPAELRRRAIRDALWRGCLGVAVAVALLGFIFVVGDDDGDSWIVGGAWGFIIAMALVGIIVQLRKRLGHIRASMR